MAATAHMPAEERPRPLEHYKPKHAAKQHMRGPTSPREPFDADLLSRKLETYRRDLKLEKARREVAGLKSRETSWNSLLDTNRRTTTTQPCEEKKNTNTASDAGKSSSSSSGLQRSKSLNVSQALNIAEKPERKHSLLHRRSKQPDPKDETQSAPYVPRFAAKQFSSTTTAVKMVRPRSENKLAPTKDKQRSELEPAPAKDKQRSDVKPTPLKDATPPKHKLDWAEPVPKASVAQAVPAETSNDTPARRAAFLNLQNGAVASSRQRPLSTALENLRFTEPEQNPYILPSSTRQPQLAQTQDAQAAPQFQARPHLKGDRHDWSQASQTGDSARASLHLRRKDVAGEDAEVAGLKPPYGDKGKRRQKSHGDSPDGLVNEAVRLIRDEKRRSSIFGVFRRH